MKKYNVSNGNANASAYDEYYNKIIKIILNSI